jgi:hypothetical protein
VHTPHTSLTAAVKQGLHLCDGLTFVGVAYATRLVPVLSALRCLCSPAQALPFGLGPCQPKGQAERRRVAQLWWFWWVPDCMTGQNMVASCPCCGAAFSYVSSCTASRRLVPQSTVCSLQADLDNKVEGLLRCLQTHACS